MKPLSIKSYIKFLSRNKLYSTVSILGFAISLMFVFLLSTYVIQELSVDTFHKNKDRIFLLGHGPENANYANPVADFVKDRCPEVETYTRIVSREVFIKDKNDKQRIKALFADKDFFKMFSFKLIQGSPSTVLQTERTVVITPSLAKRMFDNADPIGKYIYLNDSIPLEVTGIMEKFPSNTQFPDNEMVVNYHMIKEYWGKDVMENWGNSSFCVYFLEKEGTNLSAKAPMLLDLFKKDYWLFKQNFCSSVEFIPLTDIYFSGIGAGAAGIRGNSKTVVSVYFAITILILLVAILNYINLSVSQASKRGKEAALKKLLGCSQADIIRQFVFESIVMTFIAFVIGLFFAFVAEPFFDEVLNTKLNLTAQFTVAYIVILIIGIILIGTISGIIPAITIARFDPIEVVKGMYSHKIKTVYSKVLITFQYTVAFTLLVCCLFILKQTYFMMNYDMGFNHSSIFIMDNIVLDKQIPALKNKLLSVPGVDAVSFSAGTPLDAGNNWSFEKDGESHSFQVFSIDSSFFDVYNIHVEYNGFSAPDSTYILINKIGFDKIRPDKKTMRLTGIFDNDLQLCGIIDNFNFKPLHSEVGPMLFCKLGNKYMGNAWTISAKINKSENPGKVADNLKKAYTEFTGNNGFESRFADSMLNQWYEKEQKTSKLLVAFTILTIIILVMGILAMSLYYVQQKEKEIGVRKVNGATELSIIKMLNMDFIKWIVLAFIIAVPLSYYIMQKWLENYAYKTDLSWWIFVFSGLFILAISAISITMQSWKAATANPIKTLKNE